MRIPRSRPPRRRSPTEPAPSAPISAGSGVRSLGVRNGRASRGGGVQLGIPPGVRYTFDGAIATVLGPRDDALAREGAGRHARRDRHHALVGRRDRRPIHAQSRAVPDVARGSLASAGHAGRTTPARRGPSAADQGVPARAAPRLPVACLGRSGRACRYRRCDVPPGHRPGHPRARWHRADRLPPRSRDHQPRGLGARDPRLVRRTPDARGVVGRWGRPEHHARGRRDGDRDGRDGRPIVHRAIRAATSDPTRSTIGQARSSAAPRCRPIRAPVSRSACSKAIRPSSVPGRRSGSCSTIASDWQWALDTWRSLAPG